MKSFKLFLAAMFVSSLSLSVAFAGGLTDSGLKLVSPADQTMVPGVYVDVNGETKFQWEKTGLSDAEFDHYTICFVSFYLNVDNRCINTGKENSYVMTAEGWREFDDKLTAAGFDGIQLYVGWQVAAHDNDGAAYVSKETRGLNYLRNYKHLIPLTDIDVTERYGKAAGWLYLKGVINGNPDNTFRGENLVNRAEALKILLLGADINIEDGLKNDGKYKDITDENAWFVKYVMKGTKMGIVEGYEDGTFAPEKGVNTAEFLKMASEVFNLPKDLKYSYEDVDSEDWFAPYAGIAERYSMFPDRMGHLMPAKKMNRYEVAEAISQVLIVMDPYKEGPKGPLDFSVAGTSVSVSEEAGVFDYTASQLSSMAEECGNSQDANYFSDLVAKFEGAATTVYTFQSTEASQEADAFVVTLLRNRAGYSSMDEFKKDFDQCAAGGDAYPTDLNEDWLLFVNSCGTGVDDGSGKPNGCQEVRDMIEPTLKLK